MTTSGATINDTIDPENALTTEQKLQLAERENKILKQQLKYMQDHLTSVRSLIQDKEEIIENLQLRFPLSSAEQAIADERSVGRNLNVPTEITLEEKYRKSAALAQRTILENFQLREMVNELRDEGFHLRNEIYELQDTINTQELQLNKYTKNNDVAAGNPNNDGQDESGNKPSNNQALLLRLERLNKQLNEMTLVKADNVMMRERADYILRIESYMGMNIYDMIPRRLNGECKRIYQRLFDGYMRKIEKNYQGRLSLKIPLLVTQMIFHYYPWFL